MSFGGSLKIDTMGIHCSDNKLIENSTVVPFFSRLFFVVAVVDYDGFQCAYLKQKKQKNNNKDNLWRSSFVFGTLSKVA